MRRLGRAVQIIVTPSSGDGRALSVARSLQRALRGRGYATNVREFSDLAQLNRWASTRGPACSCLVCVGGDSTITTAARAALRLSVPLVPVPCGFGNLFARMFGHPGDVAAVVDLIERGEVHRVDVGVADGEIVLCHRSFGFLADVETHFERRRGAPRSWLTRYLSYWTGAVSALAHTPLASIRVEVDGRLVADRAALVTVANVETYRGFLNLTPAASPFDGLLDVFVVPRTTKAGLMITLVKLMIRARRRWDGVELVRGRRVRVTVDGQPPEETRMMRGVLPVLMPAGVVARLDERQADVEAPITAVGGRPR